MDVVKKHLKQVRKDYPDWPKIEIRKRAQQLALLEVLEQVPIISIAVKRVGIARSTYYRWVGESDGFAEASEISQTLGYEATSDVAESNILKEVHAGDMSASKFWLQNNRTQYKRINAPKIRTHRESRILIKYQDKLYERAMKILGIKEWRSKKKPLDFDA